MKNQALFSSKDKSKKLKCRLLQFLFGALRVNAKKGRQWEQPNFKSANKRCHLAQGLLSEHVRSHVNYNVVPVRSNYLIRWLYNNGSLLYKVVKTKDQTKLLYHLITLYRYTSILLSTIYSKGNNFYDLLFASQNNLALPKLGLLFHLGLLLSERGDPVLEGLGSFKSWPPHWEGRQKKNKS